MLIMQNDRVAAHKKRRDQRTISHHTHTPSSHTFCVTDGERLTNIYIVYNTIYVYEEYSDSRLNVLRGLSNLNFVFYVCGIKNTN